MSDEPHEPTVRIELLGRFAVAVGGDEVATEGLGTRAAELVQLLALADEGRLARDQLIDALWPHLEGEAGGANLRKAAHLARRALGDPEAVVLGGGHVELYPGREVRVDAGEFERAAREALRAGDPEGCRRVSSTYAGDLLPASRYEEWAQEPRERLQSLFADLLRTGGEWERLTEVEPGDDEAYAELMRRELAAGRRAAAIRWFGRLRTALGQLGLVPGAEAQALYDECVGGLGGDEPEIVGRQLELARMTALLRGETTARMLAVSGSAGVGKSAVCRELERIASAEGWRVMAATATEEGRSYAPLVEIAERLLQDDPDLLGRLSEPARSVLAELTPLAAPAAPLESRLTRHRAIGALRRLLLAAASGDPVLIVLDDAHLADEATIDALGHIGGDGPDVVLAVVAYRAESAPEPLTATVARLRRAERLEHVDLEPLAQDEALALVDASSTAGPRDPDVSARIVELGQGNPYLLLELARSGVAGVPALVRTAGDAVTARLVDLDEEAVEALAGLALAGGDLDPGDAVALIGGSDESAYSILDASLRAGILLVADDRYRFRHELVRRALVERIPPHRRIAIHRETAQRLAAAGAPPALIAARWLDGERPQQAVPWLLEAAREANRLGAFDDAIRHLGPLLDHDPDHVEGLLLRAEAMDARGDDGAPAAYAAAALVAEGPLVEELQAKRALATIKLGDPEGGLEILEGLAPTTLDGRVAHALAHAGAAALGYADPAMGTAMAAQARALALDAGDPAAVTVASWAYAAAAHARGELRESLRTDLRDTQGLGRLAVSVFDGQLCMTQRLLYGARPYEEVIGFADALATEAERIGAARGRAFAVTIRGEAKLLSGELDGADADLAAGAELHREIGAATGRAFATQRRAEVALQRGEEERGRLLLDEALAIARESDVGFHLLDRIYGTRVTSAGDPAAGLAALEEAEAAVRGPDETCPTCRITLAVPAAIAAARAGDAERAEHWGTMVEYLAQVVMRLPAWDAALAEVEGHRAQAGGDPGAAARFGHAADLFAEAGQPFDESRCRQLAAAA